MSKAYDRYPQLKQMWAAARLALCEAESVMVIGFSFPNSDASIRQLFRTCLCRAPRLKAIAIVDIDPGSVANRLEPLLAEAVSNKDVHCYLYEVPKDCSEPSWIVSSNS